MNSLNPNDIEVLARQRVELYARIEADKKAIADIDAKLVDAVEVGGVVDIGGEPVWRVQQKHTFNLAKAEELLPESVIAAATVPTVDKQLLQSLMPPALRDACMDLGKIFVGKAGR